VTFAPVLHVVAVDLALSGDNSLVVGLAARHLPPRQRRSAVAGGTAAAVVLRAALTLVAAVLLRIPYLHLLGGLLLLAVAYRSVPDAAAEGAASGTAGAPGGLLAAMATIVVADATMSLDNVLGVAAAAGENPKLLVAGLILSVALMAMAGSAIAALLGRVPLLAYAGAAVVAWTGALLALRDPALAPLAITGWAEAVLVTALTVGVPLLAYQVARIRHRPE
jgi:YjbE family integral membrane protein